jgi:hypothetical protein
VGILAAVAIVVIVIFVFLRQKDEKAIDDGDEADGNVPDDSKKETKEENEEVPANKEPEVPELAEDEGVVEQSFAAPEAEAPSERSLSQNPEKESFSQSERDL